MNQPSKTKRSDATATVKKPSAPPSLNFSIKSLDQIRAEKKRKRPHEQDDDIISGPTAEASTRSGGERPDESGDSVSQSGEEMALNEQSGPGEATDKDLPKEPAPPKRRLIIKRTSLRKNAESAETGTTGDNNIKRIKVESSAEAESSECASAKNIPSTKSSKKRDTYFDATCIDKSVPFPDSKQVKESRNPNTTVNSITHTSQDNDISTKAIQPNPPPTTSTSRDTGAVATHKRITVLKVKRKNVPSSSSVEEEKRAVKSELDIDASLLLSPVDEAKSLQGGVPERKKSIAEMKAEM